MKPKTPFWTELLLPCVMIAFGVIYFLDTQDLSRQAVFFPHTIMVVMALLAAAVILTEYVSRRRSNSAESAGNNADDRLSVRNRILPHKKPLMVIGLSAAYMIAISLLDYFIASIAFLVVSLLIFKTSPWVSLAIGVTFPLVLYVIFVVLFGVRV